MKFTSVLRFVIASVIVAKFAYEQYLYLINTDLSDVSIVSDIFTAILILAFAAYCIAQGKRELVEQNVHSPVLRIYAILFQSLNAFYSFYVVIYADNLFSLSAISSTLIGTAMSYLLIQDIRISLK